MYDVAIIGGGIGGLMAAYQLKTRRSDLKVAIFEKGNKLENRHCPASNNQECAHCKICSITNGYAGAGAFSDGKYNLGTAYGGTLGDELGETITMDYIRLVDSILGDGVDECIPVYKSNSELKLKCIQNGLRLLDMDVRHLGTDRNKIIMQRLIDKLNNLGVELHHCANCEDLYKLKQDNFYTLRICENNVGRNVCANHVIVATGRSGSKFVERVCKEFDLKTASNAVDIGVRVEMKDAIWSEFSNQIYEPKILCRTKTFEDRTRMFCFNKGGLVSAENNDGIITANGHAFAHENKKTDNCNFAILSSIHFTEPFNEPTEYAAGIAKLANRIGNGNVLVQRFGDLIRGRRTNEHRLAQNSVVPTLKATPGDISLVLPHRILTNIIETIYALDKVAPGTANDDTLLYGCEAKYYSIKPEHNERFEIIDRLYLVGDGSGITRGLSQAGAMGLYVADCICNNMQITLDK